MMIWYIYLQPYIWFSLCCVSSKLKEEFFETMKLLRKNMIFSTLRICLSVMSYSGQKRVTANSVHKKSIPGRQGNGPGSGWCWDPDPYLKNSWIRIYDSKKLAANLNWSKLGRRRIRDDFRGSNSDPGCF